MKRRVTELTTGVPIWILSFGDMITNLLACFVMLLAFTTTDRALFEAGQGAFKSSISNFGLPSWLLGRKEPTFDFRSPRYSSQEQDEPSGLRLIDPEEDKIREAFNQLLQQVDTASADVKQIVIERVVPPVTFPPDEADLTPADREVLHDLVVRWKQTRGRSSLSVLVVGLAAEEELASNRGRLSARRAQAVAKVLEQELAGSDPRLDWKVSAWGAGQGQRWQDEFGARQGHAFILIALTDDGS